MTRKITMFHGVELTDPADIRAAQDFVARTSTVLDAEILRQANSKTQVTSVGYVNTPVPGFMEGFTLGLVCGQ